MDSTDPLSELADIHLPPEIGLWPLAPGWWLLLGLVLMALAWLGFRLLKRWRAQRRYTFALAELKKCYGRYHQAAAAGNAQDSQHALVDLINDVNAVLRRVAIKHFPDTPAVASLSGHQWVAFLRQHGDASLMDEEIATALAQGRFAARCDIDSERLQAMAERWIRSHYLARIKPLPPTSTATPEHA